jgi:cytochrome c-type biogenesis protein CcmH
MTLGIFFIAAALLVLAAILFVIPPLLKREAAQQLGGQRRDLNVSIYRDQLAEMQRDLANDAITQEQYEQGRGELERRLLEDVTTSDEKPLVSQGPGRATVIAAVLVAALIPLLAAGVYLQLGAPRALSLPSGGMVAQSEVQSSSQGPTTVAPQMQDQINQMVRKLETRLAENPNDPEGWAMLGRSYLALERFDQAVGALRKAVDMNGNDAQLLVDYADALAMTGGKSLQGQPTELIDRALAIDPNNQKALWLAGTAAYEKSNYQQALDYWRRLYAMVPKGTETARAMESNISEVEALMTGKPPAAVSASGEASGRNQAVAANRTIKGTVRIDDSLRQKVQAGDTVFIFARAVNGPRMPLAVMRAQAKDLPIEYALDDSMAMDPSLSLSKFSDVVIVARISKSGGPMTQSGDLQGTSAVVRAGDSKPVQVVINEVVP